MANVPKKTLVGVVGAATAALLFSIVPKFEGTKLVGYLDPVGIPTKCMGDTTNVVVGQRYSEAECRESLERQLIAHAEPVLKCTPSLKGHTYQLAAAVSFAYNVGTSAYCGSATAKRFNAGDWRGACRAMNQSDVGRPQWVYSDGRMLPGLVKRRAEERALCERDL
ncbi:glycosyl hydrolase [Burkholderia ubonensis]|uniref:lysozyme n=1 Tax=Burkholderia ubonensis TaxID=101571 RepID=UPI0008FEAB1D|nr:lysozyme [Burkholderia ubonensis]OJA81023.1 glycosyl hydrolase [Burkholderia ubonensis]